MAEAIRRGPRRASYTYGASAQDTVKLVVQSLTSSETQTLENVPMTEANRKAIYNAALARERREKQ